MKAKELFNKLTLGNKLFVVGLAVSLSSTAYSVELATTLSDVQHQSNRCDSSTTNWRTSQKDFALACSKAGLGGVTSCKSKLENCESSSSKYSYCIGSATNREDHKETLKEKKEQEREIQERKDSLLADYNEKQNEIQRAKEAQDQIQQQLQATLEGVDNQQVEIQIALEDELDKLSDETAVARNQIDIEQLKLRKFTVEKDSECREKAMAEKNANIRIARTRQLTVNQIFGRTNLSINQAASIRYEHVMRNCLAFFTNTGKSTNFGKAYAAQKRNVDIQKRILNDSMARYERQKQRVIKNTRRTLANLNQKKQIAFKNAQIANLRAQQTVAVLENQRNSILAQVNELNSPKGELTILGRQISTAQVGMITSLAGQFTGAQPTTQNEPKVAKQDKIDAFNEALGLKDSMGFAEEDKKEVCGNQNEAAEVAKALEEINIDPPADTTTATATEVASTERTPATAGQTE